MEGRLFPEKISELRQAKTIDVRVRKQSGCITPTLREEKLNLTPMCQLEHCKVLYNNGVVKQLCSPSACYEPSGTRR